MELNYIKVGQVLKTVGFDGTMSVQFDFPLIDINVPAFFISKNNSYSPLIVKSINPKSDTEANVRWEKYDSKEIAQQINRSDLYILESQFENYFELNQEDDSLYDFTVINDGKEIGKLINEITTGDQTTIVIEKNDGGELLVPWVSTFVESVDMENKTINLSLDDEFIKTFSS